MLGGGNDLVELSKSTNSMNYYMENNYTDSPGLFTYHMLCFFPRVIFLAISFFKVIHNNSQLKVIFEKIYQPQQPQQELLQTLQNIAIELFDHETSVELNEVFLNMNDGPNYMYDMFEEDPATQTQQIEERKTRYTNYDNVTEYLCHFCYRLINDCQIEYDNNKLLLTDLQFINENLFEKSTIANEEELFNNFKDTSIYKYRLLEYYDLLFNMEYYITSTNNSKYMNTIRFVQFRIEDNIYIDPSIVSEEIVETAPPAAADTTPIKQAVEPSTTNMEVDEETEEEKRRTIIKQKYPTINDNILEQIEEQVLHAVETESSLEAATSLYKQIEKQYPTDVERQYFHLKLVLREAENDHQKISFLQHFIERNEQQTEAKLALSKILLSQNKWEEAKSVLEELLLIEPNHGESLYELASILITHFPEKMERAGSLLKQCIKQSSFPKEALYTYAIYLSNISNKPYKALEFYLKTIEVLPNHKFAYYDLATFYFNEGEKKIAREFYLKAIQNNPELKIRDNDLAFEVNTN
jgi:tetratricopeptide (TPR) repeat protein